MAIIGVVEGKYFDDLQVGDAFGSSVTLTETHLVLGSALFGDFNPVHVNETFVQKGPFQKRIFPGPFTLGVMASSLGNFFLRVQPWPTRTSAANSSSRYSPTIP